VGRGKDELISTGDSEWAQDFSQNGAQGRRVCFSAFDHWNEIIVPSLEDPHVGRHCEACDEIVEKFPMGRRARG
jgi:hypothetical protein